MKLNRSGNHSWLLSCVGRGVEVEAALAVGSLLVAVGVVDFCFVLVTPEACGLVDSETTGIVAAYVQLFQRVDRFFCRWSEDAFAEVLTKNGFNVVDYTNRPMSVRTNWHSFFVEAK